MKKLLTEWRKYLAEGSEVWYHGSTKDFDDFETTFFHTFGNTAAETSLFFSPSKDFAKLYATGKDGIIYEVALDFQNAFDTSNLLSDENAAYPPEREQLNPEGQKLYDALVNNEIFEGLIKNEDDEYDEMEAYGGSFHSIMRMDYDIMETPQMKQWMKSQGYDAFYVTGDGEKNISVFSPKQVRIVGKQKNK
jgi:hypothetical protein